MVRFDGDHVNWVLVVILVAMALLLAMVSSSANADLQQANPQAAARADQPSDPPGPMPDRMPAWTEHSRPRADGSPTPKGCEPGDRTAGPKAVRGPVSGEEPL